MTQAPSNAESAVGLGTRGYQWSSLRRRGEESASAIHSSEHFHNLCMQARASLPQPPEHSAEEEWQQVLNHHADSVSSSHDSDSSNVGENGKAKAQLARMHPELSYYAQHNSYA